MISYRPDTIDDYQKTLRRIRLTQTENESTFVPNNNITKSINEFLLEFNNHFEFMNPQELLDWNGLTYITMYLIEKKFIGKKC